MIKHLIAGTLGIIPQMDNFPIIEGFTTCGYGLLWALESPSNANYDGLDNYDIDLNSFNGVFGSDSYSLNLIKKFYGVAQFPNDVVGYEDIYLLPMADKEPLSRSNGIITADQECFKVELTPKMNCPPKIQKVFGQVLQEINEDQHTTIDGSERRLTLELATEVNSFFAFSK